MAMAEQKTQKRRSRWARLMCWGLGLAAVGGLAVSWAGAQSSAQGSAQSAEPSLPTKHYMSNNVFYLPVTLEDRMRSGLKEIQLYCKEDASQPWALKEKIAPHQNCFSFKAPHDGEYWFTVVTVDKSGRMTPSDLAAEPPGVIVVLDSQPPQVDAAALPPAPEGPMVKIDVRDVHLDAAKTQFYFQTTDKMWRLLAPLPNQPDQFCIPRQPAVTGMIKIAASDFAGNIVSREFNLNRLSMAAGTPVAQLPEPGAISPIPKVDERQMRPIAGTDKLSPLPEPVTKNASPLPPVENKNYVINPVRHVDARGTEAGGQITQAVTPPPAATHAVNRTEPQPPNKQIVSNTHVFLDYQIDQMGASGVGKVEVWITLDHGQTWKKHCDDTDRKSPAEVDLPGEGLYGLSLVVTNGRGFGGTPPTTGEAPDWWIEVDLTRPVAEITSVRPGTGDEAGALHIAWTARDKNLGASPIDLFYALKKEGPWIPIAKGLRNEGHHCWAVPGDIGAHAYIRMITTDQAGNVAQCETAEAIPLDDLSRPRGRVTGVSTGSPRVSVAPQGDH
jgi:hypothetical protein